MAAIKSTELLIVLTSFANLGDAQLMARSLIERRLAACVQINEGVHSVYHWNGKICEEQEVTLSAKTALVKWNEISAFIKSNHPYDLPELVGLTPAEYDQAYGQWVWAEVNSGL
ncbi:divalent-cation tolerance protein CutA [Polynucleobacter sp. Latsch14-2]|jgi:periplasmic divalent cation tolerance protein|uniref:divalent-cation tolerance protein CutA n=1 Tax=Polynucleobacter sp. Latsch14-2 TaxID=2576920 RepID=UPI001C0D231F|nr:divalent-cation tolerance protein CutA [Polynucleobacter sp. Latsch14-2]MBU3613927.1 divalent-cation tolerance protein CutA [Polynucleobacter sp. Latsch14-2]